MPINSRTPLNACVASNGSLHARSSSSVDGRLLLLLLLLLLEAWQKERQPLANGGCAARQLLRHLVDEARVGVAALAAL